MALRDARALRRPPLPALRAGGVSAAPPSDPEPAGRRAHARVRARPPARDGDRQREPGLVLRQRPARHARRARSSTRWRSSPQGADLIDVGGESGVTYTGVTRRRGRDRARRAARRAARRRGRAGLRRHLEARRRRGGARRRRRDRSTTSAACATPSSPTIARAQRLRAGRHAHARRAQAGATSPTTTATSSSDVVRVPARAHRARDASTAWRADQLLLDPGPRLRQDAGRRASRCCARCRALHALGRPILLPVSRKYFVGAITGRAAGRAPRRDARRGRCTAPPPARRSSASTTSPRSSTRCAVWRGARGRRRGAGVRRRRRAPEVDPPTR